MYSTFPGKLLPIRDYNIMFGFKFRIDYAVFGYYYYRCWWRVLVRTQTRVESVKRQAASLTYSVE